MNPLHQQSCEACRADAPQATPEQRAQFLPRIPDWNIIVRDGMEQLQRTYSFPDFAQALAFTNRIGALAECEGHHPALLTEWGSVEVRWWTHKIRGLHLNDFIMAAKTDQAFLH